MGKGNKYYFDEASADKVCNFIEHLTHTKGEWAGKRIKLMKWQRNLVRELFGWKNKNGTRKYRSLFLFLPRKNGKSTLAAAISLYLLYADQEPASEIYAAAAEQKQAKIIHDMARQMVMDNPTLNKHSQIFKDTIIFKNSKYNVINASVYSKAGFNAHGIIVDELFAQPNRDLTEILLTSMAARRQPLSIFISTAGYERESYCGEVYDYACKVRDGIIKDETMLVAIYEAKPEDDWTKVETWKKANPNYDISIKPEYFKQQYQKAKSQKTYEATFRRFHLNQWQANDVKFIKDTEFMACNFRVATEEQLINRECWGGLDLSTTIDISALVLIFPDENGIIDVLPYFWVPEDNAKRRDNRDGIDYVKWINEGWIQTTPGNVIDYNFIEEKIKTLAEKFQIKEIAYDRWNSHSIVNNLIADGAQMTPIGQGYRSLNYPTKNLEALIISKKINFNNNPVMRWHANNLHVTQDPAGNYKPDKKKSKEKIDGMAALIDALAVYLNQQYDQTEDSIYEERKPLLL